MPKTRKTRPYILFITGISAAGKTTVFEQLRNDPALTKVEVHDIDEQGIPQVGLDPWRSFRIEELFYNAVNARRLGFSTIICGVSFPNEIISSKYYERSANVHFVLLKIPFKVFKERINGRFDRARSNGDTGEALKPGNYRKLLTHTHKLIKRLDDIFFNERFGYVIDTSSQDKAGVIANIKSLISKVG